MTGGGGGRNKFGGHEKFIHVNSRGPRGAREMYSSVYQPKKVKTKKKGLQFKNFHKFWLSSQNSCDFLRILKGGESSSQFQWFTRAEIEL